MKMPEYNPDPNYKEKLEQQENEEENQREDISKKHYLDNTKIHNFPNFHIIDTLKEYDEILRLLIDLSRFYSSTNYSIKKESVKDFEPLKNRLRFLSIFGLIDSVEYYAVSKEARININPSILAFYTENIGNITKFYDIALLISDKDDPIDNPTELQQLKLVKKIFPIEPIEPINHCSSCCPSSDLEEETGE